MKFSHIINQLVICAHSGIIRRIQGYRDIWDTRIQKYRDTGIQGYGDTGIQEYRNTEILKDTEILKY